MAVVGLSVLFNQQPWRLDVAVECETTRLARMLVEALKREGQRDAKGRLVLPDQNSEKAMFSLLTFLGKSVSIYVIHHDIVVKKAAHVC